MLDATTLFYGDGTIATDIDHNACPDCGHEVLNRGRSFVGFPLGALLLMVGFLAALPTLGASMILCVVGVFMMVPRTRCPECGWSKRN